jgi:hypothetical protein
MKAHAKLFLFALPILFAFNLAAAAPDHWDMMQGTHGGDITITINSGKQTKGHGSVFFAPDAVAFAGVSYSRADVKEVVIRQPRGTCCESLALGVITPFLLLMGRIVDHDNPTPYLVIFSPVILGAGAVTGPALLIVEGIRWLMPGEVAYRVVP